MIEVATELPYGATTTACGVWPVIPHRCDEENAHCLPSIALEEEYSGQDEYPEGVDARLGRSNW